MKVSVVIVTKNRNEELFEAIRSVRSQSIPAEVLVVDDASTVDPTERIQSEFPGTRVVRHTESRGCIVRRNEANAMATGDIVFSIDDDAQFSTPHVIEQTLNDFDDSRIGAVAIPMIEPNKENRILCQAPERSGIWITESFIGTSHALRRDVFLKLGGYREHLIRQGEEMDLAVRMLAEGWVVRLGRADPILHFESPKRDMSQWDFYGPRNTVLFAWQNVPMVALPLRLVMACLGTLRHTFRIRRFRWPLRGLVAGYWSCCEHFQARRPVNWSTYRLFRSLRKRGPKSLSTLQPVAMG